MRKLHEITWIAGLLEGEGYFGDKPVIEIPSTDLDTIQKYRSVIGVENSIYVIDPPTDNHKIAYKIRIGGSIAIQWMMTIYPLMSSRRKEAIRKAISRWKTQTIQNQQKTHCNNGHLLSGSNLGLNIGGFRVCKICEKRSQRNFRMKRSIMRAAARQNQLARNGQNA